MPAPRSAGRSGTGHDLDVVRAWARRRGYPVDGARAVPLAVLRAYRLAHEG